ncbi:hypothetical protein ABTE71_20600, partial [Acinetobacter baumannii]
AVRTRYPRRPARQRAGATAYQRRSLAGAARTITRTATGDGHAAALAGALSAGGGVGGATGIQPCDRTSRGQQHRLSRSTG